MKDEMCLACINHDDCQHNVEQQEDCCRCDRYMYEEANDEQ